MGYLSIDVPSCRELDATSLRRRRETTGGCFTLEGLGDTMEHLECLNPLLKCLRSESHPNSVYASRYLQITSRLDTDDVSAVWRDAK